MADDGEAKEPEKKAEAVVTAKELEEKSVKKAFLKRFRKKEKKSTGKQTKETKTQELSSDQRAEDIYRDIAKTRRKKYWVIRIKKTTIILVMGGLLVIMWLVAGVNLAWKSGWIKMPEKKQESEELNEESITESAEGEVVIKDPSIIIRIRDNGSPGLAEEFKNFLAQAGYQSLEVMDDHESDYSGIAIVVKPANNSIREELVAILGDKYSVSSPSAELTDDSQVDALILFGLEGELASESGVLDEEQASESGELAEESTSDGEG